MNLGVFVILAALLGVAAGAVVIAFAVLLIIGDLIWRAVHKWS